MYIDFLLLFFDYYRTLTKRIFLFEWLVPLFGSVFVYFSFFVNENSLPIFQNYRETIISLLGVLIGFSITVITLLITTNNNNVEGLKSFETNYKIGNKKINLFDLLVMNFSYSIIVEIFLIVAILFYPAIKTIFNISDTVGFVFLSVSCFSIIHLLFLYLRNVCDLYFILTSKIVKNKSSNSVDKLNELKKLGELYGNQILTKEEFEKIKIELLNK